MYAGRMARNTQVRRWESRSASGSVAGLTCSSSTRPRAYEPLQECDRRGLGRGGSTIRRFADIGFRGEDWDRRPWVIGTGLDVWEIVDMLRSYDGDVDRLVADNHLERRHVQLALSYHEEHREEIDEAIAEDRHPSPS